MAKMRKPALSAVILRRSPIIMDLVPSCPMSAAWFCPSRKPGWLNWILVEMVAMPLGPAVRSGCFFTLGCTVPWARTSTTSPSATGTATYESPFWVVPASRARSAICLSAGTE